MEVASALQPGVTVGWMGSKITIKLTVEEQCHTTEGFFACIHVCHASCLHAARAISAGLAPHARGAPAPPRVPLLPAYAPMCTPRGDPSVPCVRGVVPCGAPRLVAPRSP